MIDDLSVSSVFEMWKYVDDTTVSECIPKGQCSKAQVAVDQVIDWSKKNLFQLNGDKTKELTMTFSHNSSKFPRALIDSLPIESVDKTKLLGVTINSSLTWNDHIEDLLKKAFRKLYFLVQLKRAQIPPKDLIAYYCACIRSTLDYACPLFHHALPKYLQLDLERVQKRALSRIFPRVPYCEALKLAEIEAIRDHQNHLTKKLFQSVVNDPSNNYRQKGEKGGLPNHYFEEKDSRTPL